MKYKITTVSMIMALAFTGTAFAASMDEDLHGVCMKDKANSDENCSCAVDLVKSHMAADDYTLLHAMATTEDGSDERNAKLAALGATPEKMQAMNEKFNAMGGDLKSKCNVTINNNDGESAD
ncbi:MAG: hypothetical protein Q9M33_02455 [Robiginitomaculum sp.]|nr:hypothetical protein [Robiginitomaculum sp.]MDQ7078338.1 hypothetical protein [Robiginitomaculum sp.]